MSHTYLSRKTAKILYAAWTAIEAAIESVTKRTAESVSPAKKYMGKSAASKCIIAKKSEEKIAAKAGPPMRYSRDITPRNIISSTMAGIIA